MVLGRTRAGGTRHFRISHRGYQIPRAIVAWLRSDGSRSIWLPVAQIPRWRLPGMFPTSLGLNWSSRRRHLHRLSGDGSPWGFLVIEGFGRPHERPLGSNEGQGQILLHLIMFKRCCPGREYVLFAKHFTEVSLAALFV